MATAYDSEHAPYEGPAPEGSGVSGSSGVLDSSHVTATLSEKPSLSHGAGTPPLSHGAGTPPLSHRAGTPPLDTGTLLRLQAVWPEVQQDSLRQNLARWQCLALADTLGNAVTHCRFYKERLDQQKVLAAIARLKQASSSASSSSSSSSAAAAPEARPENTLCTEHLQLMGTILSSLPFTSPSDLAADAEQFMAVGHDDVEAAVSVGTSGTTGPSKRIFATQGDLQASIDFFRYGMRYLLRPGTHEKVALLMSGTREGSVGDLLGRALAADGLECVVCGFPETEESMLLHLAQVRPTCIVGVPAQIYALARHGLAASLRPFVRTVLLSGDTAVPSLREAIAEAFECEVFLHYGLTEVGLGGYVECPAHNGCHGRELDLFIEIIDEQGHTHAPIAHGATPYGEIVITTLTRKAMPLLRYRTGDIGRLITTPCACGSALWRLDPRGRGTGVSGALLPPRFTRADQAMQNGPEMQNGSEGGISSLLEYEAVQKALYALPWLRDFRVITHDDSLVHVVFALCPVAEEKHPENQAPEVVFPKGTTAAMAAVEAGTVAEKGALAKTATKAEAEKALASVIRQLERCGVRAHIVIAAEGSALRQRLFPAMVPPKKLPERHGDAFSRCLY